MCIVCMSPYAAAATAAAAVCRYRSWSARFQRVVAVGLMAFASMRMHVCAPICLPVCPASYTVVFAVSAWLFIFAVGSKSALDANRRQLVHELSILVHLDHNIATPCKLAFKKYLWNSWPVECLRAIIQQNRDCQRTYTWRWARAKETETKHADGARFTGQARICTTIEREYVEL